MQYYFKVNDAKKQRLMQSMSKKFSSYPSYLDIENIFIFLLLQFALKMGWAFRV